MVWNLATFFWAGGNAILDPALMGCSTLGSQSELSANADLTMDRTWGKITVSNKFFPRHSWRKKKKKSNGKKKKKVRLLSCISMALRRGAFGLTGTFKSYLFCTKGTFLVANLSGRPYPLCLFLFIYFLPLALCPSCHETEVHPSERGRPFRNFDMSFHGSSILFGESAASKYAPAHIRHKGCFFHPKYQEPFKPGASLTGTAFPLSPKFRDDTLKLNCDPGSCGGWVFQKVPCSRAKFLL